MTLSCVQRFWRLNSPPVDPLPAELRLSEFFNPGNVRAGQWFTRLWMAGEALEPPLRLRVERVQIEATGRIFHLRYQDGPRMSVCGHTLKTDFRRICGANRQPFTGEALPDPQGPVHEKAKKHWYE